MLEKDSRYLIGRHSLGTASVFVSLWQTEDDPEIKIDPHFFVIYTIEITICCLQIQKWWSTLLVNQNLCLRQNRCPVMWLYTSSERNLTCGRINNPSLQETADVEVAATLAFLLSVLLLLLFLASTAALWTGGGGKGLLAATLDWRKEGRKKQDKLN